MHEPKINIYVDFFSADIACISRVDKQLQLLAKSVSWDLNINKSSRSLGLSWNKAIYQYLLSLEDDQYVFIWFDDLYICDLQGFISRLQRYIKLLDFNNYDYIRLTGKPPATGLTIIDGINEIALDESYQCSLVGSLWRVSYLKDVLCKVESPWSIEHLKHTRSACASTEITKIKNYYIKGAKNIWHYPGGLADYRLRDYRESFVWGIKRSLRVFLSNFPLLYHKVYSR